MNIPIEISLAIVAIVVTLLVAGFAYYGSRDLAKRQHDFERRLYVLTILDPAKGKITQFIGDMKRKVNAIKYSDYTSQKAPSLSAQMQSPRELMDKLAELDRQVDDTYKAISHHLYPDDKTEIEIARKDHEKLLNDIFQNINAEMEDVHRLIDNMFHYAEKVWQAIDRRLENTLALDVRD